MESSSFRSENGTMADLINMDEWPNTQDEYTPDLEHGIEIRASFREFAAVNFSATTSVTLFTTTGATGFTEKILSEQELSRHLNQSNCDASYEYFFVNRLLTVTKSDDATKLQISQTAWINLVTKLRVSPAFTFALSRYYLPTGKGKRVSLDSQPSNTHDFWYFLPIRMKVRCKGTENNHSARTGGSNQMNPIHSLHLPDHAADIRGAQIAIYSQYNGKTKSGRSISVNMVKRNFPTVVEEPQTRIKEALEHNAPLIRNDPFFMHIIYFTSAMRLWTNALDSINLQLISWETKLQEESHKEAAGDFHENLNKALHAMAAHLYRYASELNSLEESLEEVSTQHRLIYGEFENDEEQKKSFQRVDCGFSQILSNLRSIRHFEAELDKKIQNALALLFNRIQLGNDKVMVANSTAMQHILEATQEETKASHAMAVHAQDLTEEMRKDSLSMKTIAILGMVFLPGTSFAALLAMPFFATNQWLDNATRFWVWIALTLPSTGLAFAFYWYSHRPRKVKTPKEMEEAIQLEALNGATSTSSGTSNGTTAASNRPANGTTTTPSRPADGIAAVLSTPMN